MFQIGQEIVAIIDHPQGIFKKWDHRFVEGTRGPICACGSVYLIDTGDKLRPEWDRVFCFVCNISSINPEGDRTLWHDPAAFVSLDKLKEESVSIEEKIARRL